MNPLGKKDAPDALVQTLTLAFVAAAVLAGAVALARRSSPPGRRRDALSVALVVLALLGAFIVSFALGALLRAERAQAAPHANQGGLDPVAPDAGARRLA
jgi:heme A synthase